MATFLIHEDEHLKENACVQPLRKTVHPGATSSSSNNGGSMMLLQQQQQQQQRKTFGVLNNVQLGARAHAQKTGPVGKTNNNALQHLANKPQQQDENAIHQQQQLKIAAESLIAQKAALKPASFVPVDAFKAFCVYEDNEQLQEHLQQNVQHNASIGSLEAGPMARHPLQELKADARLETPMSVGGDLQSPMSVDKSMAGTPAAPQQQRQQHDRDAENTVALAAAAQLERQLSAQREERERFFDVREYQSEILDYLKEAERKHLPKYGYMRKQPDINHSMRTILVDWLVEVCEEYRLQSETLCLAVSYIDRFLSTMSVVRAKLQLVGTAAMFIAAKYEEIYPPDVNEFVYITDHTYTKKQVLRMEQLILKVLTFDLFVPTATVFLNLYATMNPQDERVKHLTAYLCELSLLEADPYLQFVPSVIAAAAMAMARHTIGAPMWSAQLQRRTGYGLEQLHDVLVHLACTIAAAPGAAQQAIQDKYKASKFLEVSTLRAAQPFDEVVYKRAVIAVSHDEDSGHDDDDNGDEFEPTQTRPDDEQREVSADAAAEQHQQLDDAVANTTGVRRMISSIAFA